MRSNINFYLRLITLNSLFACGAAFADVDEIYHLSIGTNLERYNSEFSINSNSQPANGSIDFEDDLGYDSRISTLWISGWYRVGDAHRIQMTYVPLTRSARAITTEDIILGDTEIKAGAALSTDTKTDILDFSYIYSFYHSPQFEAGVSVGLYWLFNKTSILAAGDIQSGSEDQPSFKSDFFSEQNIQAPMPLLGLNAIYELNSDWRFQASMRYLSVKLNDVDGVIATAEIGAEYYFNSNWGVGMSLSYFDLDITVNSLLSNTNLSWGHNGVQLYATFKY